jgi:hypothetical protein
LSTEGNMCAHVNLVSHRVRNRVAVVV